MTRPSRSGSVRRTPPRRQGLSLVEVMLALTVLALAFLPLLTVMSGSKDAVVDAERFLGLLEDAVRAPGEVFDPSRNIVRSTAGAGAHQLALDAVVLDPHAGVAPLTVAAQEVR